MANILHSTAASINDDSFKSGQNHRIKNHLAPLNKLFQATVQLLFIADLKHKRIDEEKPDEKPGSL